MECLCYECSIVCMRDFRMNLGKVAKWFFQSLLDTSRQFHQHFTYKFFVQTSFFYVYVTREKLLKRRSYEKCAQKMLMKLTPAKWATFLGQLCHDLKLAWALNQITIAKMSSVLLCVYLSCIGCIMVLGLANFSKWSGVPQNVAYLTCN